ncbi:carbohydrate ABC transporter permease [Paenibacillus sp. JTLBN-2024]
MVSVSGESSVVKHGYSLFPDTFSWDAYRLIFSGDEIWRVHGFRYGDGDRDRCRALLSAMLAHTMARQKVRYRNGIALFIFITMIFNAGLVPWYIFVTKYLHLKDTLAALILPMLINPFHVFLIRNYFKSLPPALLESAEMEGAGPLYVFAKIMLPLSAPIIATVALFYSLAYWNDWGLALWLIDDRKLVPASVHPVQNPIHDQLHEHAGEPGVGQPNASVRDGTQMAMVLVTIGPIILVYPFIQRYFVKRHHDRRGQRIGCSRPKTVQHRQLFNLIGEVLNGDKKESICNHAHPGNDAERPACGLFRFRRFSDRKGGEPGRQEKTERERAEKAKRQSAERSKLCFPAMRRKIWRTCRKRLKTN